MTPARAVLALAVRCLGDRRRDWALAMRAELDAAEEDGRPMAFATGCLVAAWRELPTHADGRAALAGHALALLLIVPMAAMLATCLLSDFPVAYLAAGGSAPWLNEGNRSAVPSLALLVAALAASHLRIAWLVLDRDWEGAAAAARLIAAIAAALVVLGAVAFADPGPALIGAAMSAVLLGAAWLLARIAGTPEGVGGMQG